MQAENWTRHEVSCGPKAKTVEWGNAGKTRKTTRKSTKGIHPWNDVCEFAND